MNEGERGDDLFLQFTQPLTDRYKEAFTVPGGTCFWRGKLEIRGGRKKTKVVVEGGLVVSETERRTKLIKEGTFTALLVTEEEAMAVKRKSREAFERALTAPRGENTGFKTPARIAGAERSQRRAKALAEERKKQIALQEAQEAKDRPENKDAD